MFPHARAITARGFSARARIARVLTCNLVIFENPERERRNKKKMKILFPRMRVVSVKAKARKIDFVED